MWQVAHCPGVAELWLYRAPKKVAVLKWQLSHGASVTIWLVDFGVATTRLPIPWQPSQFFGVPLNTPPT
ncbi:MAG: hypothetical protein HY935_05675 [Nitrosomonadales bacterium]|nr:hypothetical protein [Nitrosomonadales bacterium]